MKRGKIGTNDGSETPLGWNHCGDKTTATFFLLNHHQVHLRLRNDLMIVYLGDQVKMVYSPDCIF